MKPLSDSVLKTFLSRCPPEKQRALEKFLPEKQRQLLEGIDPLKGLIEQSEGEDLLEKVHWSWFLPTLKSYPEAEQKLFLSVFETHAAKNLARTLLLSNFAQEMAPIARTYLRELLLRSLLDPQELFLTAEHLPPSPINALLNFSKKELTHLIDLLSLYDLAAELRQIVETKILKKIYSLLTEEERNFLKNAMVHKEHFSLGKMGLDRWDGTEESLRLLLHRKGLARFGTALSGQNPHLIWYICHQLDIGRGNALFKLCMKEPIHGVSDMILRQIEELL